LVQTSVWQSPPTLQILPAAHLGHDPPQSLSVSLPFLTLSLQAGAAQVSATGVHTPLSQSPPTAHFSPVAQSSQFGPPQSTSVSAPFFWPSAQFGAAQRFALQTLLAQSVGAPQDLPAPQPGQVAPPQSESLSSWFFTPSVHDGASHLALVHELLKQSLAAWHVPPVAHPGQPAPPQS
jgi:hypothetical protein